MCTSNVRRPSALARKSSAPIICESFPNSILQPSSTNCVIRHLRHRFVLTERQLEQQACIRLISIIKARCNPVYIGASGSSRELVIDDPYLPNIQLSRRAAAAVTRQAATTTVRLGNR